MLVLGLGLGLGLGFGLGLGTGLGLDGPTKEHPVLPFDRDEMGRS